jgi:hypothetical protein
MEIDTNTEHPNPQPSNHYGKIQLQSPLDLAYLQDNLAKSALAKLDLHFPAILPAPKPATVISLGGSEQVSEEQSKERDTQEATSDTEADPLRSKVHDLITEFLHKTWTNAQANIVLNGLDASTLSIPPSATISKQDASPSNPNTKPLEAPQPEEIEGQTFHFTPVDPRLQHKLASLHGELERLTAEVSALRRTAPQTAAQRYESALSSAIEAEDLAFAASPPQSPSQADNLAMPRIKVRPNWNTDIKETYETGVRELSSLAGVGGRNSNDMNDAKTEGGNDVRGLNGNGKRGPSLMETMGKVQRARTVALEME